MHVHSHMQGASPVRRQDVSDASTRPVASTTSPFAAMPGGTSSSASGDVPSTASASFSSLSNDIQALLLGVGQNGQPGSTPGDAGSQSTASALQAYGQSSRLFN